MKQSKIVRGYSIVELLVATTILTLIVALLASVVSGVSSAWSNSIDRGGRETTARAIADYIRSDLTGALLPMDETSQTSLQFVLNPAGLSAEYKNGDALFWQAPIATNTAFGEIAEVGYFVRWTSRNNVPAPILCRFFVNPASQDTDGNPVANPDYLIHSQPDGWINNDLLERIAPGVSTAGGTISYDGLFAENVVAIWFRCLDSRGKAFARDFDSRVGQQDSYQDPITGNRLLRRLPASVQVSFVLLDARASQRLNGSLQADLTSLAQQTADIIAQSEPNDQTVSPAQQYVETALNHPDLRTFATSLRSFTTTIQLSNSK